MATARRLHATLGASVEFWMCREALYHEDSERIFGVQGSWLDELPVADMIEFGWLPRPSSTADAVRACLRFFGVPNVSAWHSTYADLHTLIAFRASKSFDAKPGAVAAWLRKGELEGCGLPCRPWDPTGLRSALPALRALTREKDPVRFIPKLQQLCGDHGVAFVIVRAPAGCRASGATRFLSPDKALLMLSGRHLSDDHFWFSFFHEAGHLLLHGVKGVFLEGLDGPTSTAEAEANAFASETLIPADVQGAMLGLPAEVRAVIRFAYRVGVAPGIVVGQMQHHGVLKHHQMNQLRRRFTWDG